MSVDELIDRARRGEATVEELQRLTAWRRATAANEQAYRQTMRLLDAASTLVRKRGIVPSAASILAVRRSS